MSVRRRRSGVLSVRSLHSGKTADGKPFTNEGMAIHGNDLYLLPEAARGQPKKLYHFVLTKPDSKK